MASPRPRQAPTLRQHATGVFFVHWAGRDHYFTKDRAASERLFLGVDSDHPGALRRWQEWSSRRFRPTLPTHTRTTVAELVRDFCGSYHAAARPGPEQYYRRSLRRFVNVFGRFYTDELDEVGLESFLTDLARLEPKLAPKTIAHDINAVKTLLRWGARATVRLAPRLDLDALKPPRVRKGQPEDLPLSRVKDAIAAAAKFNPQLGVWTALNYLAALRASEVARLAHGQGRLCTIPPDAGMAGSPSPAIPDAFLELYEHKMSGKQDHPRVIPLSAEALVYYRALTPLPVSSRRARRSGAFVVHDELTRYGKFCARAGLAGLPHRLRDSAATHLLATGQGLEASVDLILGHEPSGELTRYGRPSLRLLRDLMSRLTLR